MKRLRFLAVVFAGLLIAAPARAALILEFFQGTSQNDTTLSGIPLPVVYLDQGTLNTVFVQVAMRQTAPTTLIDATDGLAAFLLHGVFGSAGQAGSPNLNYVVPATVPGGLGRTPLVNVADPGTYSLVRSYRLGPNSVAPPGGTENYSLAFRFGGLNLNPPPSPSVDANGRIFLGTFALRARPGPPGGNTSIIFQDPNPAAGTIDNITDMGDNIDAVLFNGNTYELPIIVPVPEATSHVLAGLVATGTIGLRLRRKSAGVEKAETTAA